MFMSQKLSDILKKAYMKGVITKKEYESGIKEIKRQKEILNGKMKTITKVKTVRIPEKEMVLGEIKIIKDAKGPRVVFDTGKEQVPLNFDSDKVNFPASLFYDALRMGNRYAGFGFSGISPMLMPAQTEGEGTPINLRFSSGQSDQLQKKESPDSWYREEAEEGKDDVFKQDETIKEEKRAVNEEPQQNVEPEPLNQQNVQEIPKSPEEDQEKKHQIEMQSSQRAPSEAPKPPEEPKPPRQAIDINIPAKPFGSRVEFVQSKKGEDQIEKKTDEEIKLIDMKKEIPPKEKKAEEKKKKKKKTEEKKEGGLITGVTKIFKQTKKENREAKLERLAKENLEKIKEISDRRKAIIKVAHVLKDFLEIKLEINFSTTYGELIDILKEKKEIHDDIKKEIIGFFQRVSECEYAGKGFEGENFSDFYKSARRIIEEMSD